VRKGDLRWTDLRGAKIDACDFCLVDVRGARMSSAQREHLRRRGAIVEDAREGAE